jgi:replicative DNA helicase
MSPIDSNVLRLVPTNAQARTLPHSIEAEQALLGAIIINNDAYYRVQDFLEPTHFFEPIHIEIFELLVRFIRAGKVATTVTLKTFLPEELNIEGLSLDQYLARLAAGATTIINAEDYGRLIYYLSIRRALVGIGSDIVNLAYDAPVEGTPSTHIEDAEKRLYEIAETGRYGSGFQNFERALARAVDMTAAAYERDGKLSGLATGLRDLDSKMGGLQKSDLIILAGRPGMGKTALVTNIAYNVAKSFQLSDVHPDGHRDTINGGVVGFFSLEMSAEQLASRIIAEQTGIPSNKMRRGDITQDEFEKIKDKMVEIQKLPLFIDETGGVSIAQLAARARRLKRQRGLDLIVIDYIQLMQGSSRRAMEGRVQEITEITTNLKALAKELNVPIIALSQLSRQVENREDKHPQLSDLRESGSIEQDADVVLFVYREEYYLATKEPRTGSPEHEKWLSEMDAVHGRAEVIIGKQRHGPTGTVPLHFDAQVTRFADPETRHPANERD